MRGNKTVSPFFDVFNSLRAHFPLQWCLGFNPHLKHMVSTATAVTIWEADIFECSEIGKCYLRLYSTQGKQLYVA